MGDGIDTIRGRYYQHNKLFILRLRNSMKSVHYFVGDWSSPELNFCNFQSLSETYCVYGLMWYLVWQEESFSVLSRCFLKSVMKNKLSSKQNGMFCVHFFMKLGIEQKFWGWWIQDKILTWVTQYEWNLSWHDPGWEDWAVSAGIRSQHSFPDLKTNWAVIDWSNQLTPPGKLTLQTCYRFFFTK